jgi:hypothetical protein
MALMGDLKHACAKVLEHLEIRGCLGVAVIFPAGNTFTATRSVTGDLELHSRRYVAAVVPPSFAGASQALCDDNKAMRSSQDFDLRMFPVQEAGLSRFADQGIHNIVALSLPLIGSTFYCTAYFCFGKCTSDSQSDILRDVSRESYLLWSGLSRSLRRDTATFGVSQSVLNMLLLSQSGYTSREISEKIGVSHRVVERQLDKFKQSMSAENKLDAIQKAQILRII